MQYRANNKSIKKIAPVAAVAFVATMLVGAFSFTTTAYAAVTFDRDNGTGFVGKGDVQNAFSPSWNDATLQTRANDVSFTYEVTEEYTVTIQFSTESQGKDPEKKTHTARQDKVTDVDSSVAFESRKNSQGKINGFNLNGFGSEVITGDTIPKVGDSCPNGNVGDCVVTDVKLESSSGGLFVHYGDASKQIYP